LQATKDPSVVGLALRNPWVRSEAGLARAQVKHYYRQRLLEPAFWRKLLVGGVGWRALRSFASNLSAMRSRPAPAAATTFQARMALAWRAFPGPILLLLSQRDLTAQEFESHLRSEAAWIGALDSEKVSRVALVGADHTCSHPSAKQMVLSSCLSWLSTAQEKGDHRSPF